MKETVEVTQEHIDVAKEIRATTPTFDYRGCISCPIAQALLPRHPTWRIRHDWIDAENGGLYKPVLLPAEAIAFIDAFDHRQPVEPITFEIEVTPKESTDGD